MPFTPFHLGPAFGIGLPLRKYLHVPTFIIGNIIIDIEPFLVLVLGLKYPLHGYLHTFIGASIIGILIGYVMYILDRSFHTLWKSLKLIENYYRPRNYLMAGVIGTILHVLLDSPLYHDIKPLYPLLTNPFYDPELTVLVYGLCIFLGVIGFLCYLIILFRSS
ncbi:MAG: hydrolase [Staphylothermus sp.]|nr:hydrolase [Staphylothermus sp.]